MDINKYVSGIYIDTKGLLLTLKDGHQHLLTTDVMSKHLLRSYIQENLLTEEDKVEDDAYQALVKVWDLTDKLPNCQTKEDIIQIAGSVIYKDN